MANCKRAVIVFDVSSHGFGHLGQIAPVITRLISQYPLVRIIVRSMHPASVIYAMLPKNVAICEPPPEATLVMKAPAMVDGFASAEAYRVLHESWDDHLDREVKRLAMLKPTTLVADVPYLSLAAAKRLDIRSIALCSLNWLDIYRTYCGQTVNAPRIISTIKDAYCSADVFLQPRPHMPMSELPNRYSIGPIARLGTIQKNKLRKLIGLSAKERLVLVTFGGIQNREAISLPDIDGVHWIVGATHAGSPKRNVTRVDQLKMNFIDVLASSDVVITKVGYGTFVEAACNGVSILSGPRADWPESVSLIDWAKKNANIALIKDDMKDGGLLQKALMSVLNVRARQPVFPSGISEAVDFIAKLSGID